MEDNLRTKAAEVALQQVADNKQLLELLDVTPPYFALQDLRATDMVSSFHSLKLGALLGFEVLQTRRARISPYRPHHR